MATQDTDGLTVEVVDDVGVFTIDRPDRMNAFTPEVLENLRSGLEEIASEGTARSAVLTGAGDDAFCVGADLGDDAEGIVTSEEKFTRSVRRAQRVLKTLRGIDIPVVAGVNGYALGAGMDLALGCDLRVVRADAELGQAYVNVGLVPGDGGAYMLPRMIGEAKAKELIFTGKRLSGTEAVEMDLAVEAVDGDAAATRDAAIDMAAELAAGPSVALGHAKQLINESFSVSLSEGLDHALDRIRVCYNTEDHREAVLAFNENREPEFEGR